MFYTPIAGRQPHPAPWIDWEGGKCPLHYGETFDLEHRDGVTNSRPRVADDNWMNPSAWEHQGNESDIVRYRVRG